MSHASDKTTTETIADIALYAFIAPFGLAFATLSIPVILLRWASMRLINRHITSDPNEAETIFRHRILHPTGYLLFAGLFALGTGLTVFPALISGSTTILLHNVVIFALLATSATILVNLMMSGMAVEGFMGIFHKEEQTEGDKRLNQKTDSALESGKYITGVKWLLDHGYFHSLFIHKNPKNPENPEDGSPTVIAPWQQRVILIAFALAVSSAVAFGALTFISALDVAGAGFLGLPPGGAIALASLISLATVFALAAIQLNGWAGLIHGFTKTNNKDSATVTCLKGVFKKFNLTSISAVILSLGAALSAAGFITYTLAPSALLPILSALGLGYSNLTLVIGLIPLLACALFWVHQWIQKNQAEEEEKALSKPAVYLKHFLTATLTLGGLIAGCLVGLYYASLPAFHSLNQLLLSIGMSHGLGLTIASIFGLGFTFFAMLGFAIKSSMTLFSSVGELIATCVDDVFKYTSNGYLWYALTSQQKDKEGVIWFIKNDWKNRNYFSLCLGIFIVAPIWLTLSTATDITLILYRILFGKDIHERWESKIKGEELHVLTAWFALPFLLISQISIRSLLIATFTLVLLNAYNNGCLGLSHAPWWVGTGILAGVMSFIFGMGTLMDVKKKAQEKLKETYPLQEKMSLGRTIAYTHLGLLGNTADKKENNREPAWFSLDSNNNIIESFVRLLAYTITTALVAIPLGVFVLAKRCLATESAPSFWGLLKAAFTATDSYFPKKHADTESNSSFAKNMIEPMLKLLELPWTLAKLVVHWVVQFFSSLLVYTGVMNLHHHATSEHELAGIKLYTA